MNKANLSRQSKKDGFANRSYANYIPTNKIAAFETLYNSLLKHYGSACSLEKELEVGKGVLKTIFKDKKLSEHYAKKILNKFNEVRKSKKAINHEC